MMKLLTSSTCYLSNCEFKRNLSDKTLKAYEADLSNCRTFVQARQLGMLFTQLGKEEIKAYPEPSLKAMLAFDEYEHECYRKALQTAQTQY